LIPNDGSGFGHFTALALQHAPLYTRFRAGDPRQVVVMNHDPDAVIGVDVHGWVIGYLKGSKHNKPRRCRLENKTLASVNRGLVNSGPIRL
jgi:hypothetical protein